MSDSRAPNPSGFEREAARLVRPCTEETSRIARELGAPVTPYVPDASKLRWVIASARGLRDPTASVSRPRSDVHLRLKRSGRARAQKLQKNRRSSGTSGG